MVILAKDVLLDTLVMLSTQKIVNVTNLFSFISVIYLHTIKIMYLNTSILIACDCDKCGTQECDHRTGQCSCLDNVVGEKCDRCADNHYGFTTCEVMQVKYLTLISKFLFVNIQF